MNLGLRALAFVGIGLLIHAVLSLAYVRTAGGAHRAFQLDAAFLADDSPLELLVLGDSHARNAVDASILPRTESLALGGEHYLKTYYRLKWLLERTEREIAAVALPLDITSFTSWKADNYAPEYVWGRYIPLFELGMRKEKPFAYAGKALKAHLAPYAGEAETLVQYAGGTAAFRTEPGLGQITAFPPAVQRKIAVDTAKRHFQGQDWNDRSLRWALANILKLARARDMKVVLVSYPLTEEYVQVATRVGTRAVVRDRIIPEVVDDPDLIWLDYEAAYFGRNELFFDADHLNTLGRPRFTRRLGRDLVKHGVLTPPQRR